MSRIFLNSGTLIVILNKYYCIAAETKELMAATALQNNFGSTWLYMYQNVGIQSPTLWPHIVALCALCTLYSEIAPHP